MWLALIGLAAAARPMYVHTVEGEPGFEVRDHRGERIGAWHFAHFVRDRRVVDELRPLIYGRRMAGIAAGVGGLVCFGAGLAYLRTEGRVRSPRSLQVRGDVAAAGAVATGGLLLVASSLAIARSRPKKLRVDEHYTLDEAVNRIRMQGVVITPAGLGIQGSF